MPIDNLLTVISSAAKDTTVDVEKAERLFALLERMHDRKAEMDFNDAMVQVQTKMVDLPIVRTAKNPQTNSAYAKLETIQAVINPILLEHGFSISFGTDKSELPDHYGVTATLAHRSGHKRQFRCDSPVDMHGMKGNQNKTRTHGFGSALSYGERYLMKLIFNLRMVGEDDDGNMGQRVRPQGPSSVQPASTAVRALATEVWTLLTPIRGTEKNWNAANQWLWQQEILDGGANESLPNLSETRFREVIAKCKTHPDLHV